MGTQHLFFDLDRTLWDFERNSEIALNELFSSLKLEDKIDNFHTFHSVYKEKNALLWKQYGLGVITKETLREERFRATLNHFNIDVPSLTSQLSDGYVELSPQQTALFPKTIETLEILKKEGYNMHIITNGFKEVQHIKLKNSALEHYFDVIVCSEDIGKNKPSPEIFHHSLKNANAKAVNSVMIGDDYEIDILGALGAGMKAVLFDPNRTHHHEEGNHWISELAELPGKLPWIFRSAM
jgi:putative hydrolase of the HAD superfamily